MTKKYFSIYHRKVHLWFILATLYFFGAALFFVPGYTPFVSEGDNLFTVFLNGEEVGIVDSKDAAENCLLEARRSIAATSAELIYMRSELSYEGQEVLWGETDPEEEITARMIAVLDTVREKSLERCYTLRIRDCIVTLPTKDDVLALLETALERYDEEQVFMVRLVPDPQRDVNVFTAEVIRTEEHETNVEREESLKTMPSAGVEITISDALAKAKPVEDMDFEDYPLGLVDIGYAEKIEVVESYMPTDSIMSLEDAKSVVLKDRDEKQIYEVVAGDTLSEIAEKYGLTTAGLVALNPMFASDTAMIRIGDELTVTVPKPELSVLHTSQEYLEQEYTEPTIYIDNDSWYVGTTRDLQEGTTGHRRVIALVSYQGDSRIGQDIVKEEVDVAAQPRIVERGTKARPTYIWPVSGGYISSGFGGRSAPKAGASTYHKGVDIAVSTGTAVMASSAGTVTIAGWQSGYGYVVYINHADGRQTRYGHLSRILVSPGQYVEQGQKIALSGNTGNSTGPHLHFEIRIGGEAVNPVNYVTQ